MAEVALALLWHQHQPYYPDNITGQNPMPWVRLHGVKDYYGMALHLLEYPEMRCTINLVPSLLQQLRAYTENNATDQFLLASRLPADGLAEADCEYLLDHFFMANLEQMIAPFARYAELYQRRGPGQRTALEAVRRFQERDYRDLQVCFNLAWIHPLAFERDTELRALRDKGRNFTESEKSWLLDKHLEILRAVLPLHRKLGAAGQVELTTTPYYHPILPLLFDKKLARESIPDARLPRYTGGYPDDAAVHVRRAIDYHAEVFGVQPRGMWPAEGSVCQAMLPLLASHGIAWIATDEEILSCSTQGFISRDARGHVRNPDRLYRPYKVAQGAHELGIIFRDHALSDLVGFHYQRSDPVAAADDFMMRLRAIGQAVDSPDPVLVSVILDGENCWEHYPAGGVSFLRALYERCSRAKDVQPVSVGAFLERFPPRNTLPQLFAGSWINHNFAIWVGHDEDNTAWDALHRAREHLCHRSLDFGITNPWTQPSAEIEGAASRSFVERIRQAWEEIYIAEGSDWYWWFGDDHSSSQDALFDYLFRKHLQNVYVLLGDTPPPELARPISRRSRRAIHTLPRAFLEVKVDGRQTFFEWYGAGRYSCHNERGTMAMVARGPVKDVYFGFDLVRLFVRVDFDAPAHQVLPEYSRLRLGFVEPANWELTVAFPGRPEQAVCLCHEGSAQSSAAEVALDQIMEIAIPFHDMGIHPEQQVQFFVELLEANQSRDRAPREGTIALACPSADFEEQMWDV
jgi:alpha-amylase/alpha-mannosidase (GH57 family)